MSRKILPLVFKVHWLPVAYLWDIFSNIMRKTTHYTISSLSAELLVQNDNINEIVLQWKNMSIDVEFF